MSSELWDILKDFVSEVLAAHGVLGIGLVLLFFAAGATIKRLYVEALHAKDQEIELLSNLLQQQTRANGEESINELRKELFSSQVPTEQFLEGAGSAIQVFPDPVEFPITSPKLPVTIRAADKLINREQRIVKKMREEISKRQESE